MSLSLNKRGMLSILVYNDFVIGHKVFPNIFQVSDKTLGLPDTLRNTPPKLTRSEFHGCVFPVLASLASYHSYLDPNLQQRLIKCLEFGLVSRCARQCVMALTTCTLEMKDAMYKLLPGVLLSLSKISATVHIAIPILEFLSSKCAFSSSFPVVFIDVNDPFQCIREMLIFTLPRTRVTQILFMGFLQP